MVVRLTANSLIFPVIIIGPWINILIRHGYLIAVIAVFFLAAFLLILVNNSARKTNIDAVGLVYLGLNILSALFSFLYHYYTIGLIPQEGCERCANWQMVPAKESR